MVQQADSYQPLPAGVGILPGELGQVCSVIEADKGVLRQFARHLLPLVDLIAKPLVHLSQLVHELGHLRSPLIIKSKELGCRIAHPCWLQTIHRTGHALNHTIELLRCIVHRVLGIAGGFDFHV